MQFYEFSELIHSSDFKKGSHLSVDCVSVCRLFLGYICRGFSDKVVGFEKAEKLQDNTVRRQIRGMIISTHNILLGEIRVLSRTLIFVNLQTSHFFTVNLSIIAFITLTTCMCTGVM